MYKRYRRALAAGVVLLSVLSLSAATSIAAPEDQTDASADLPEVDMDETASMRAVDLADAVDIIVDELGQANRCTLQDAVEAANTLGTVGSCVVPGGLLSSTKFLITIPTDVDLDGNGQIDAAEQNLLSDPRKGLGFADNPRYSIRGAGIANTTIDLRQHFVITEDMMVAGVKLIGWSVDQTQERGGAFHVRRGHLHLSDVSIERFTAAFGGGIFVEGPSPSGDKLPTLRVDRSMIFGNKAKFDGGGVYYRGVSDGDPETKEFVINNSTIQRNEAGRSGGGFYVSGQNELPTTTSIWQSTIRLNSAPRGASLARGGRWTNPDSKITVFRSTIQGELSEELTGQTTIDVEPQNSDISLDGGGQFRLLLTTVESAVGRNIIDVTPDNNSSRVFITKSSIIESRDSRDLGNGEFFDPEEDNVLAKTASHQLGEGVSAIVKVNGPPVMSEEDLAAPPMVEIDIERSVIYDAHVAIDDKIIVDTGATSSLVKITNVSIGGTEDIFSGDVEYDGLFLGTHTKFYFQDSIIDGFLGRDSRTVNSLCSTEMIFVGTTVLPADPDARNAAGCGSFQYDDDNGFVVAGGLDERLFIEPEYVSTPGSPSLVKTYITNQNDWPDWDQDRWREDVQRVVGIEVNPDLVTSEWGTTCGDVDLFNQLIEPDATLGNKCLPGALEHSGYPG